jgi:hypothetical protein
MDVLKGLKIIALTPEIDCDHGDGLTTGHVCSISLGYVYGRLVGISEMPSTSSGIKHQCYVCNILAIKYYNNCVNQLQIKLK